MFRLFSCTHNCAVVCVLLTSSGYIIVLRRAVAVVRQEILYPVSACISLVISHFITNPAKYRWTSIWLWKAVLSMDPFNIIEVNIITSWTKRYIATKCCCMNQAPIKYLPAPTGTWREVQWKKIWFCREQGSNSWAFYRKGEIHLF